MTIRWQKRDKNGSLSMCVNWQLYPTTTFGKMVCSLRFLNVWIPASYEILWSEKTMWSKFQFNFINLAAVTIITITLGNTENKRLTPKQALLAMKNKKLTRIRNFEQDQAHMGGPSCCWPAGQRGKRRVRGHTERREERIHTMCLFFFCFCLQDLD